MRRKRRHAGKMRHMPQQVSEATPTTMPTASTSTGVTQALTRKKSKSMGRKNTVTTPTATAGQPPRSSPDEHRQAGAQQFPTIECAVITVSDTRTELDDKSGALIQSMLKEAGHEIVGYRLVKNDAQQITQALTHMLASRARFVMLTGGTGPGTKDITVETVQSLLEKELTGFGELFRILSYEEIGAATILSRATAGRIGNKFVVCCPGSSGAVRLALSAILIPELAHILREMNR